MTSIKPATARAPLPSTPELAELVREYERAFADANASVAREEVALAEDTAEAVTIPVPVSPPSGVRMSVRQNGTARERRDRRKRESRERRAADGRK